MKQVSILATVFFLLTGCFKDEPKIPQYHSEQEIDVAVDSVIYYSAFEDFDFFILSCSAPNDSVHWYRDIFSTELLGSGQPFQLQNNPFGWGGIRCLSFLNSDTTVYNLQLNYCARFMYIPRAFTPENNGINDHWAPVYQYTYANNNFVPYSIHWEIRTLDGLKVFEADGLNDQKWDGRFNGYRMPYGAYLFYIELNIEGEDPVEYTGWLEMLG